MPTDKLSPHKGRGAVSNPDHRFATRRVESGEFEIEMPHPGSSPDTVLRPMVARSIISSNQSPDVPFDKSINPYQGCEHGCIYCYARPTHSYLDLSPGLDFETQIFYKPNAVPLLLEAWEKPGYSCEPITIGANTDPYQPAEKSLRLTRSLLETFLQHSHPVNIITKGLLIERDLDLLGALAKNNLCSVAISIATLDNDLKRTLEPRVPAAKARLSTMRKLSGAGVPVTLLLAPLIPAVNDGEIEEILEHAGAAGAERAAYILLRLPFELKQVFRDWLSVQLPDRATHVMSLLRQASGGRDYDSRFGHRQAGRGPYPDMLGQRFRSCCKRLGIVFERSEQPQNLDCHSFRRPGPQQASFGF